MGILESARGKGFGKTIIGLAVEHYFTYQEFFCYIREYNKASIKSFIANGFIAVDESYQQFFPLDGKKYTMYRYEFCK